MSLKAFHLFFISVSVLLCWGFAAWCLLAEIARAQTGYALTGIGAIVVGIALVAYEIGFLRKCKNL